MLIWIDDSICVFPPIEKCFARTCTMIRNHYICGHACRDTGLYQLIYHPLLRSYQNTFNLRFYKRVICKRSVAIIVTCRGQMMSVCWQWALAWNDGLSAEGLSRTERKKNQTNWTKYNLINCTSHRSISMKQYLSLLFDNLSEKGRNIFFYHKKNDVLVHTIYYIWWCRIRSRIYKETLKIYVFFIDGLNDKRTV